MAEFIAEDTYRDLSGYFDNDEYPALRDAYFPAYLKNNMLGTDKNYGIPFSQSYGVAPIVYYRGDLRKKYGCEPVTSPETYRAFLDAIVENEPGMIPYAATLTNYNVGSIFSTENDIEINDMRMAGVWDNITSGGGLPTIYVYIKDYKVVEALYFVEPDEAFANFPAPYNTKENIPTLIPVARMAREFAEKGWLDRDFMTATDSPAMFYSGKGASLYWDTVNYTTIINSLKEAVPEAEVEIYQPSRIYQQDLKGKFFGNYAAWNFLCIPVTTPDDKADRIMKFYNWLFSSWDNHDLFEFGISGKNFELVGGDQYRIPEGVNPGTNYSFPGYQLTWNPNFIRISADYPDAVVKYIRKQNDPGTYYEPVWSGFSFQRESVANEVANPDIATIRESYQPVQHGQIADIKGRYAELEAEYTGNKNLVEDLTTIKNEYVRQLQAHLDKKKAQG